MWYSVNGKLPDNLLGGFPGQHGFFGKRKDLGQRKGFQDASAAFAIMGQARDEVAINPEVKCMERKMKMTMPGCEAIAEKPPAWFHSARLGLLANQSSVTRSLDPAAAAIRKAGGRLACLLSPQHGFHAVKQANMIESPDGWDEDLGIPLFSLYGDVREPTPAMLEHMDVLLIDLQDVGTRVYTFGTTMGLCLEAAAKAGLKVAVLDRPNPISGAVFEGNIVDENYRSFVGRYALPMRHGLTMGELARFIVKDLRLDCDLEVIPMAGWKRSGFFPDTGLQWVFPSPNMPSWETALLYPGMVLFEGANVSEGRGTTLPFQLIGAPFIDAARVLERLKRYEPEGVFFRPVCFEPVFDKWRGEVCRGFQIHILDREKVRPYRLGLELIQALLETHPNHFRWLPPPYEYEREKLPIDILMGDGALRRDIEEGCDIRALEEKWSGRLAAYRDARENCLLYK